MAATMFILRQKVPQGGGEAGEIGDKAVKQIPTYLTIVTSCGSKNIEKCTKQELIEAIKVLHAELEFERHLSKVTLDIARK